MKLRVLVTFSALLLGLSGICRAGPADFGAWLSGLKRDAEAQGVPAATVNAALDNVSPLPRVLELDRSQPETTLTFEQYMARTLVAERIERGRQLRAANAKLLRSVSARYGVSAKTIVALWGVESSFGHGMGNFRAVDALATLAFDGRRPDLFRAELIDALKIIAQGRFGAEDLRGSWAGAMGQIQFMPSTYLRYAADYAHGGAPDIWRDTGDVFASAAN